MANKPLTLNSFKQKCEIIHHNKYDYSLVAFSSTRDKVRILCPDHGEYEQRVSAHMDGQGCRLCRNKDTGARLKFSKEQFLQSLNVWQKNNLDFSKFVYITDKTKGTVICTIHDTEFSITPSNIKRSRYGCPLCSRESHRILVKNTKEDFIRLSLEKHGDTFDYSDVPDIFHSHEYIKIKCKLCMSLFERIAYSHCNTGHACPKCSASKTHKLLEEFLDRRNVSYSRNDRTVLEGREIDILLSDKGVGIECNGNYWHSEEILADNTYHLRKTVMCEDKGIQLLHFFEDELIYKMPIVQSIIEQKIGICSNKVYARNCIVREVDTPIKNQFLNDNHIQGEDQSKIKLGLYHRDLLVSLMTFGTPRYNKSVEWELIRFCNIRHTNVVGGASKLLSAFIRGHSPKSIISYADKRISNGNLYNRLGFKYSHDSEPRYYYFPKKNPLNRLHRSNFTKEKIRQKYPHTDISKTEKQIMEELGFGRIWDCGTRVYIWR